MRNGGWSPHRTNRTTREAFTRMLSESAVMPARRRRSSCPVRDSTAALLAPCQPSCDPRGREPKEIQNEARVPGSAFTSRPAFMKSWSWPSSSVSERKPRRAFSAAIGSMRICGYAPGSPRRRDLGRSGARATSHRVPSRPSDRIGCPISSLPLVSPARLVAGTSHAALGMPLAHSTTTARRCPARSIASPTAPSRVRGSR